MPRQVVMAVRSDSFAGVEQYICTVSSELAGRGWQVAVIGGQPDLMGQGLHPSVDFVPARSTAAVARELARLGRRPLVHVHMTAAETAAVLTQPVTRSRIVATRHFAAPRGSSPLVRIALRPVTARVRAEVAISEFVASRLERPSTVIRNGVGRREEGPDDGSRRVLVMQRLEPEKCTEVALHAWQLTGLGDRGWTLALAGRGSRVEELRLLAERLGIAGSVSFIGFAPDALVEMTRSAVFLATAAAEPFGLAVVEAMATGLPVVASRSGAHPETLADTGLLFPVGDAAACAEQLTALASSPALRRDLGKRARSRQREQLSLPVHVDRLEQLYQQVVSRW